MATCVYNYSTPSFSSEATFGFEYVDCVVGEGAGEKLVCVVTQPHINTDCPVAFPFTLHFLIKEDTRTTAGKNYNSEGLVSHIN